MSSDAALAPMTRPSAHSRGGHRSTRGGHDEFLVEMGAVRSASLAVGSAAAYRKAVRLWSVHCQSGSHHRHGSLDEPSAIRRLDRCVVTYLDTVYHHGAGRRRQLGVNTVYGLYYYYPSIRGRLAQSEQHLRGWSRLRPSMSRPPLTWPLVTLIAVTMAMNGYGEGALASLVAFDALLRISELTALRVRDISSPTDPRRGRIGSLRGRSGVEAAVSGHVLLRLAVTKTGRNQWVELTNVSVEALLLQHISGRQGDEVVFNLLLSHHRRDAARAYRHALRVVCRGLGLEGHHFTPHSLRHGGATHALWHLRQSIETVMLRGRWQSMSSCRTYLQAGRAQLLQQSVDPAILALAETVSTDWYDTVRDGLH
jgi:integrase